MGGRLAAFCIGCFSQPPTSKPVPRCPFIPNNANIPMLLQTGHCNRVRFPQERLGAADILTSLDERRECCLARHQQRPQCLVCVVILQPIVADLANSAACRSRRSASRRGQDPRKLRRANRVTARREMNEGNNPPEQPGVTTLEPGHRSLQFCRSLPALDHHARMALGQENNFCALERDELHTYTRASPSP